MTLYEKIDAAREKLAALPPLSNGSLLHLDEEFIIRYTYNSNAIEGSTLSEWDTFLVLQEDLSIEGKPLKHQIDAIGHRKAYAYVKGVAENGGPISEETILETHRFVLMSDPENAGRYRDVPVYIAGSDAILERPEQVPAAMQRLLTRNSSMQECEHLIDRIALFHLAFESIHPFVDGNGRTGRLLMNHELLLHHCPPIDIKNTDKGRYYYCLQQYQGPDETDLPMKQLVGEYVLDALYERISALQEAHSLRAQNSKK